MYIIKIFKLQFFFMAGIFKYVFDHLCHPDYTENNRFMLNVVRKIKTRKNFTYFLNFSKYK